MSKRETGEGKLGGKCEPIRATDARALGGLAVGSTLEGLRNALFPTSLVVSFHLYPTTWVAAQDESSGLVVHKDQDGEGDGN